MYIFLALVLLVATYLYPSILFSTISNYKIYRRKLGRLKHLSTLKHTEGDDRIIPVKKRIMIYYTCVIMIFEHLYLTIFQILNKSIVKISKNTYELTYMLNDNTYKILIKTNIGPQPKIIQALDENDNDITENLRFYFGPTGTFHGIKYTPRDFSIKTLTLNMSDTRELTFDQNDEIILTKEPTLLDDHISRINEFIDKPPSTVHELD